MNAVSYLPILWHVRCLSTSSLRNRQQYCQHVDCSFRTFSSTECFACPNPTHYSRNTQFMFPKLLFVDGARVSIELRAWFRGHSHMNLSIFSILFGFCLVLLLRHDACVAEKLNPRVYICEYSVCARRDNLQKSRPMNERLLYVLWTFIMCAFVLCMDVFDWCLCGKKLLLIVVTVVIGGGGGSGGVGIHRKPCHPFVATSWTGSNILETQTAQSHHSRFSLSRDYVCVWERAYCDNACVVCLCKPPRIAASKLVRTQSICQMENCVFHRVFASSKFVREEMRVFLSNHAIQNWTVFVQLNHCHLTAAVTVTAMATTTSMANSWWWDEIAHIRIS